MELTMSRTPATTRERWGWYLYDFGNSAYAAIVLLSVFPIYFTDTIVGGTAASRLWGIAVGIAMLVVLAALSVFMAGVNIFGGFAVTRRMLEMFRK